MRRQFNLMTTMILGGLWHGAGWNFVIWGALHGCYLVVHHAYRAVASKVAIPMPPRIASVLAVLFTFVCVVFAWVYFRATDLATANRIVLGMIGVHGTALPDAIASRLGSFWPALQALGVQTFLGGGSAFVETWAWVVIGALLAFFFPNTQQIMSRYEPALFPEGRRPAATSSAWVWRPLRLHAVAMGALLGLGILAMSRPTEFLYFQF
jgi:hypothetical protein